MRRRINIVSELLLFDYITASSQQTAKLQTKMVTKLSSAACQDIPSCYPFFPDVVTMAKVKDVLAAQLLQSKFASQFLSKGLLHLLGCNLLLMFLLP